MRQLIQSKNSVLHKSTIYNDSLYDYIQLYHITQNVETKISMQTHLEELKLNMRTLVCSYFNLNRY